jgi:hypothetical protein
MNTNLIIMNTRGKGKTVEKQLTEAKDRIPAHRPSFIDKAKKDKKQAGIGSFFAVKPLVEPLVEPLVDQTDPIPASPTPEPTPSSTVRTADHQDYLEIA